MNISKLTTVILICALTCFGIAANAGNRHNQPNCDPQPTKGKQVPIDGGITLLAAAGAAIGIKKAWQKNKSNTPDA